MKIKSKIYALLIIACILLSVSMVSANENLSDEISVSEDNQFELELNQDKDSENILNNNEISINTPQEGSSNFTQLSSDLANAGSELNITNNYKYLESDVNASQNFRIGDLTINGNNHVLDASASNFGFKFSHNRASSSSVSNLIINDLTFTNFNSSILFVDKCNIILNNVNFTDCVNYNSAMITAEGSIELTVNNCNFKSNDVMNHIFLKSSKVIIRDSYFSGTDFIASAVMMNRGQLIVENSIFENFNAYHGSAINYKGDYISIRNSKFLNSRANATGGAMIIKFFPLSKMVDDETILYYTSDSIIENCQFINLSSSSNGGAIYLDMDSGTQRVYPNITVKDSNFTDCKSKYGGAISIIGGYVNITSSNFTSNNAGFEGGAIYTSWTGLNITNSAFTANTASKNAGALYFDKGNLLIKGSNFTNNKIIEESNKTGNAIYAYDVNAYFHNSSFDNGGVGVYADFAGDSQMINVTKNNDTFLMDNHEYIVSIETPGIKLNLTGNQITVDTLPSRFDARDWGWTTPGKIQSADNYDCWAFATTAALETALKKSTGVSYNLSENYVQKLQLKYFKAGDLRNSLTGFMYSGLGYALSWYGVLPVDGIYDDRGMISDTDLDDERIHVQDAMIIYTGQDDTVENIKRAIIKYGAVTVQSYVMKPDEDIPTEGEDIAIMDHGTHFITLIGWDDNYQSDESSDPHFVWFTKDSMEGFLTTTTLNFPNIDFYAITPQRAGVAFIFENNIDYHVNYQTDLTGLAGFDGNYTSYSNEFTSKYDEFIGAVGTYFNESGISYSFDVFVNGEKVHTQTGVSEYPGFRTIVLNKYIPVKTGDVFKVVFKSNSVPYQAWSRVHYLNGTSLASADGNAWVDFAPLNKTVCLKVYTVADDTKIINNKDIAVDYDGGSYFSVKIVTADGRAVGAGESVKFTINGKTNTVKTDNDGIARIKIGEAPGKYTITTSYNGVSYKNTVTVKHVVTVSKVSVKNTDKKLLLKATLKINGKAIKGKTIKFTFKGKTYKAKTNKKGVAKVTIKKKVIKKLTKKSYPVKVSYLKDSVKGTVKVKQVLKAYKAKVKKSSKKLKLKATLKINGKAAKKKTIKFKFKSKTYKAKTNKKGIAKVTIKKKMIKKLKKGKTYKVKVSYGKAYVMTTVKVKK